MTQALLLATRGSDETLYATYTCMRYAKRMHVIVCTQDADESLRPLRSLETKRAISLFGCSHHEWPMAENKPKWEAAKMWLEAWSSDKLFATKIENVYAPAIEIEGDELRNAIGLLALDVFGDDIVTHYPTVSRWGTEVLPPTAHEIVYKLRALACYESRMPGLVDQLDLREWWAE